MRYPKTKKNINHALVGLLICAGLCLLIVHIVGEVTMAGAYNVRMIKERVSPDGGLRAVNFEWSTSTTPGFVNRVSLLKSDRKLHRKDRGNIFIGDSEVSLFWDNDTLVLYCDREAEIYKKVERYDGVIIKYRYN